MCTLFEVIRKIEGCEMNIEDIWHRSPGHDDEEKFKLMNDHLKMAKQMIIEARLRERTKVQWMKWISKYYADLLAEEKRIKSS